MKKLTTLTIAASIAASSAAFAGGLNAPASDTPVMDPFPEATAGSSIGSVPAPALVLGGLALLAVVAAASDS